MDTVVAFDLSGGELPEQVKQFVKDLNWLQDEGFIEMEEVDGLVRLYPTQVSSKL